MGQPASVVVVSPDPTTLQGLVRALARSGWLVASSRGWSEAESWLRRIPVSLVVTDVDELGTEELGKIRRLRMDFPHVPVIALVSLSTPGGRAARAEGLVVDVLEKPITLGQLEEAVESALSRSARS